MCLWGRRGQTSFDEDTCLWLAHCNLHSTTQGAPEGILDRCSHLRVNGQERQPLTPEIKAQILDVVRRYGTGNRCPSNQWVWSTPLCPVGQDTLRCLAMATVEQPGRPEEMNLEDAKNFVQYEVGNPISAGLLSGCGFILAE